MSREAYHAIHPHPGLSPVPNPYDAKSVSQQRENETLYRRLLIHGALTVLLPTEDLENACLQALLTDILADFMLGKEVGEKVCEGWFLWESISKLLDTLARENDVNGMGPEHSRPNQLQQFGLLSNTDSENDQCSVSAQAKASSWIWLILQYAFFAFLTLRFIVTGLFRNAILYPVNSISSTSTPKSPAGEESLKYGCIRKLPVLEYRLGGMVSQLLDLPRRMPWLDGLLALLQYFTLAGPGRIGDPNSVLDR